MSNKIKISLITATLNRYNELNCALTSLLNSIYDKKSFEIIIVDQNPEGFLDDLLANYDDLQIKHIMSRKKGLSYNRNLGIQAASGEIICFPDDDCYYYFDTLALIDKITTDHSHVPFFISRINNNRPPKDNFLNSWFKFKVPVNLYNFYFFANSNSMVIRKKVLPMFNESMGVGAPYGSSEDVDLLYRILKDTKSSGLYTSLIQVSHPDPPYREIPLKKINAYSSGFGFFVVNEFDPFKLFYLILLTIKKFIQFLYSTFNSSAFPKSYFTFYFKGLLKGLQKK
jgi:glycosyltransferase involved in cell wall biosynthesis